MRQARGESRTQHIVAQTGRDIPGQNGLATGSIEHTDVRAFDFRLLGNGILDVTEFNTEAADFDLKITATKEFEVAVGQETPKVAGTINPAWPKGVGLEFLCGQFGTAKVFAGHAIAANANFTDAAERRQLAVGAQNIGEISRQRATQLVSTLEAAHLVEGGQDSRFGRAVDVCQLERLGPETHGLFIRRLAATEKRFQIRQGAPGKQAQHGRRQESVRDACLLQQAENGLRVRAHFARCDDEFAAMRQRVENLQHAGVEIERGKLHPAAAWPAIPEAFKRGHEVRQHAALNDHAFGLARRSRGVDHIGRALCRLRRVFRGFDQARCIEQVVDIQDRAIDNAGNGVKGFGVGNDRRELCIADDETQALGRHAWIKRQITGIGRQYAERRLDHVFAARQTEPDQRIGLAGTGRSQVRGDGTGRR